MTGPSAFELLLPLADQPVVLGLDAMREALARSGDPQLALPSVHITGTNGKGSTCAMVHAILRASGVRAGLYTSPHLHHFVERVVIDDAPVDASVAARLAAEIVARVASGALPALTFFEATTLLAWQAFREAGASWAVLEVGMGARLDATNLCASRVTAITRVALDHTRWLGASIAEIAFEKAGILKPGVPCVLGPDLREGEARAVIDAVARSVGAGCIDAPSLRIVGRSHGRAEVAFAWGSREVRCVLGLAGDHQVGNAAVALGVCATLDAQGVSLDAEAVCRGLSSVRWPARMESIGRVLIDGAHNLDGVRALCAALDAERPIEAVLFGASNDKPWAEMLRTIVDATGVGGARRFYAAAPVARAVAADDVAAAVDGVACASPSVALNRALDAVEGQVLVCGSLYFVARVRAALLGIVEDPPISQ